MVAPNPTAGRRTETVDIALCPLRRSYAPMLIWPTERPCPTGLSITPTDRYGTAGSAGISSSGVPQAGFGADDGITARGARTARSWPCSQAGRSPLLRGLLDQRRRAVSRGGAARGEGPWSASWPPEIIDLAASDAHAGRGRDDYYRRSCGPDRWSVVTTASAPAWEETLRDGRVVVLRSLRSDDVAGVEVLWRRLDAASRRLFTDLAHLPPDRPGDVAVPRPGRTAGIVAVPADPQGRVVGIARYERTAADTARALVFVDASWRRTGLGTVLLRRLAEAARHAGVRLLAGDVPRSDAAMLGLLEELGLEYEEQATAASVHASFVVQEIDAYLDALLADQRAAARVSVAPFLCPRSIALVGASDKPGSIGALLLANLLASGFDGPCTRSTLAISSSAG